MECWSCFDHGGEDYIFLSRASRVEFRLEVGANLVPSLNEITSVESPASLNVE